MLAPVLFAASAGFAHAAADMVLSNYVVSPDPMPAGGTATITITVNNNGTDTASNVTVTDTIPPGSTFVSMVASDGGTCTGAAPYSCTWASFPYPAAARTVTLKVTLPTATVWHNVVDLTSDTADSNAANNHFERDITTVAAANLAIAATHNAGSGAVAGTPFNYTLTVSNNGPDALPAGSTPNVTFQVPAGASITGTPTGSGWACTPNSGYPQSNPPAPGATISCQRNDALAAGGASYPAITVPATGNINGTVSAAFGVGASFPDGDLANNTITVDVPFNSGTDMGITKTSNPASGSTVVVGDNVVFTLTARRNGGVDPSNIEVSDTLPVGWTYVNHSAPLPWSCSFAAPTLSCTYVGTYTGAPGTTLPPITLTAAAGVGALTNVATVALPVGQTDPISGNNTSSTVSITGSNDADLRIVKTASISPVVVGQAYNWVITPRNWGPAPVLAGQTITVMETIPAGMQLNGLPTGAGWACNSSGGATFPQAGLVTVICTRPGPLAANTTSGNPAPSITVSVQHTATGSLNNRACVGLSGTGPSDPDSGNNCANVPNDGTITSADLSITKSSSGTVVVGQPLTYTLTVHNAGPDAASNVTVSDTLANLLDRPGLPGLVGITTTQGTCTPAAPASVASATVSCNLGTLNNGGSATVTITIRPDNTGSTILSRTNTATVTSSDVGDPSQGNNSSATISSNVTPEVDVVVQKSVLPTTARVGEPLVYTVTARNNGPSAAATVQITDILPPNTAMLGTATASNGGTCTAPAAGTVANGSVAVVCTWASIPRSVQYTATFRLRPLAAAVGTTIHNVVNVTTATPEPNLTNNSAFADAAVISAELDILVHKTDSVDPVALGSETEYTIDITNVGPSIGTNLVMTDVFPAAGSTPSARFSYQGSLALSGTGGSAGSCTEPAVGAISGTLVCTFPTIQVGAANKITIKYRMRAESIVAAGGYAGTQRNHASVRVDETETQMTNNAVDEDTTSSRTAIATDLALTKSVDRANANPGDSVVYTLTVTNNGSLASAGAQAVDVLPTGLVFVSSPDGCTNSSGTVTCAVGALANGATRSFHFTAQIANPYTGAHPLVNTATLDAPGDTNPGNNTGTASTNISGGVPTDLSLTKAANKTTVNPGEQIVYTLTVRNNGALNSVGAQIVDTLPVGVSFVSSPDGCVSSGSAVTCAVGNLANGASRSFSFTAQLADPYTGPRPLVNTATVNAPGDTDPSNNTGSASTTVDGASSIPTLSEWGVMVLAMLMAGLVMGRSQMRYRRRH